MCAGEEVTGRDDQGTRSPSLSAWLPISYKMQSLSNQSIFNSCDFSGTLNNQLAKSKVHPLQSFSHLSLFLVAPVCSSSAYEMNLQAKPFPSSQTKSGSQASGVSGELSWPNVPRPGCVCSRLWQEVQPRAGISAGTMGSPSIPVLTLC